MEVPSSKEPHETMNKQLAKLAELMKEWLPANPEHTAQEAVLQSYFEVNHFLKIAEFYDDHYETTVEVTRYELTLRQFCIEPAPFLQQVLDKGKASLLFSASFTPLDYYQEVLGGGEKHYAIDCQVHLILQIKNPDRKLHPDDLPATDSQSASDRRCPLSNGSRKVRQLYGFLSFLPVFGRSSRSISSRVSDY